MEKQNNTEPYHTSPSPERFPPINRASQKRLINDIEDMDSPRNNTDEGYDEMRSPVKLLPKKYLKDGNSVNNIRKAQGIEDLIDFGRNFHTQPDKPVPLENNSNLNSHQVYHSNNNLSNRESVNHGINFTTIDRLEIGGEEELVRKPIYSFNAGDINPNLSNHFNYEGNRVKSMHRHLEENKINEISFNNENSPLDLNYRGNKNNFPIIEFEEKNPLIESPAKNQSLLDILKLAEETFEIYINEIKKPKSDKIDIYEIQNLLDVIGIKKNEFELSNKILELKSQFPKKYREEKYSKENFIQITECFKNYRIDEKLLVALYRRIDREEDGTVGFDDLKRISQEKNLNFSDEEIFEILEFFNMENRISNDEAKKSETNLDELFLTFENFCKIYYQG